MQWASSSKKADLRLLCYGLSFDETFTDEEIDKGMQATKALGTSRSMHRRRKHFPRVAPFAEKYGVTVALHNHTNGPEDFEKAMAASKKVRVNLDVGHFLRPATIRSLTSSNTISRSPIFTSKIERRIRDRRWRLVKGTLRSATFSADEKGEVPVPGLCRVCGHGGQQIELTRCLDYCRDALA